MKLFWIFLIMTYFTLETENDERWENKYLNYPNDETNQPKFFYWNKDMLKTYLDLQD